MKKALKTIDQDFKQKKFSLYDLLVYSMIIGAIVGSMGML